MKYQTPENQQAMKRDVHASQRQQHVTPITSHLSVVTVISNPMRYYMRQHLYHGFAKMVEEAGAKLYTVELALRDRHFEVTDPGNPQHIQLRSPDILWHKENLLNIGFRHLPHDAEYVAWVDADVQFARPDWVQETLHQLQIYKVVQMWSHNIDYGPDHQPIAQCGSLFASYMKNRNILQPINRKMPQPSVKPSASLAVPVAPAAHVSGALGTMSMLAPEQEASAPGMLHTGYAWAARRSAISDLGGLGDIGILGSGDRHMAYALLGQVQRSFPLGISKSYVDYWLRWQDRAEKHIERKVGIVPGTVNHYWHGSKQHRRYQDRWKILVEDKFDPNLDLKYDFQGVLQLTGRNQKLRDDIIQYFAVRNEDSSDL